MLINNALEHHVISFLGGKVDFNQKWSSDVLVVFVYLNELL
jgi:hypothetical protein